MAILNYGVANSLKAMASYGEGKRNYRLIFCVTGWLLVRIACLVFPGRLHLMLLIFKTIHPRVEAALDAVPAAAPTTIVAPVVMTVGWKEALTIIASALTGLRLGLIGFLLFSTCLIAGLRLLFG